MELYNGRAEHTAKQFVSKMSDDVIWSCDLLTYNSLENFLGYLEYTLKILFNVLMSLLDQFVASSLWRGGERLELGGS